MVSGTAPFVAYATVGVLTATTFVLGGFMREQVCIYMCPWPRIHRLPVVAFKTSPRRTDGRIGVIGAALGHLGDYLFRGGIDDGKTIARGSGDPIVVDEEIGFHLATFELGCAFFDERRDPFFGVLGLE